MSLATVLLLVVSNVFMTFAWYGHLKHHQASPLWVVVLASWGIAFFEYCFQVPGNRVGSLSGFSTPQLKIMQEAITLLVFIGFARFVLREELERYASRILSDTWDISDDIFEESVQDLQAFAEHEYGDLNLEYEDEVRFFIDLVRFKA